MRFQPFSRESKGPKIRVRPIWAWHAWKSAQWHLESRKSTCPRFFFVTCSGLDLSLPYNQGLALYSSWCVCLQAGWWLKMSPEPIFMHLAMIQQTSRPWLVGIVCIRTWLDTHEYELMHAPAPLKLECKKCAILNMYARMYSVISTSMRWHNHLPALQVFNMPLAEPRLRVLVLNCVCTYVWKDGKIQCMVAWLAQDFNPWWVMQGMFDT